MKSYLLKWHQIKEIRTRRKGNAGKLPNTPDREKGPRRTAAATYPSNGPAEAFNGFVATDFRLDSKAVNTVRATSRASESLGFPRAPERSCRQGRQKHVESLAYCFASLRLRVSRPHLEQEDFLEGGRQGEGSERRQEASVKRPSFVSSASNAGTDLPSQMETCN